VWKRARNKEMHNRMRVKWKHSYLDDSMNEGQALGDAQQDEREAKNLFLEESMEEGQALGDAQQDDSEVEVLLSGWQCGRGPGIGRCSTG